MLGAPKHLYRYRPLGIAITAAALVGCSDDPAGPEDESFNSLSVEAISDWAFVHLGDAATIVQVADPTTSTTWDLSFYATAVMLNGGAAGPGAVEGYCVCQNEGATDDDVIAMTPESEAAAFEAVTAAQIPTEGDLWESDALVPAIDGWYSYNPTTHVVSAAPEQAWKLRTAEGTAFAKVHVTVLADNTVDNAGKVTLEFATQPDAGQPLSASQTLVVDVAAGPVYVDLLDAAVSDASNWDLRLEGYTIRVNGGVSGAEDAAAIAAGVPYNDITDAGDVPAQVYKVDAYGGVFAAKPWYRYDLQGNHQIWPTYNVYVIRTDAGTYKVQLTGYYNETGQERHISFRYAKLSS